MLCLSWLGWALLPLHPPLSSSHLEASCGQTLSCSTSVCCFALASVIAEYGDSSSRPPRRTLAATRMALQRDLRPDPGSSAHMPCNGLCVLSVSHKVFAVTAAAPTARRRPDTRCQEPEVKNASSRGQLPQTINSHALLTSYRRRWTITRPPSTVWPSSSTSCTGRRWTCSIPWCEGRVDRPTGLAKLGWPAVSPADLHLSRRQKMECLVLLNYHHSFQ